MWSFLVTPTPEQNAHAVLAGDPGLDPHFPGLHEQIHCVLAPHPSTPTESGVALNPESF